MSTPLTRELNSRQLIGARTGFVVLALATVFIAAWLSLQSRQAVVRDSAPALPALEQSADLKRFRATADYLPDEPMLGFVAIPAGAFIMGSDPTVDDQAYANERWSASSYQGHVDMPIFYMARYEVTVMQFRAFVAATGHRADQDALRAPATHPMTNVTWTDAVAYAHWLDTSLRASSQTPAPLKQLLAGGYRVTLPSEAEWEKAARGTDERIYPWGNMPNRESANFGGDAIKPVGAMKCAECAFGLADMSGNVWELTRSPHQSYPFADTDAANLQADALFVMRGGSFSDGEGNVRSAVRGGVDPGARSGNIGFRVVITAM